MGIKQLNASYLVKEDRILLRFNTPDEAEYRLWITRRIGLFMLAAATHLLNKQLEQMHVPETAKAIDAFEKEALVEASKIANGTPTEYQSGIHFPLGAEPVLVMDASCSLIESNANAHAVPSGVSKANLEIIAIDLMLPGGANLNLKLNSSVVRAITLLLDQLRHQAGWGELVLAPQPPNEEVDSPINSKTYSSAVH
jgi:hypothetical protein